MLRNTIAAVAVAVLFGFAQTRAVFAETKDVTFAAYNLKNYLHMDRRVDGEFLEDAPKPEPELAAMLKILGDIAPDILGVCEIGSESDLEDLAKRLAEKGVDLPHRIRVQGADETRTLAILSRYPVVDSHHQTGLTYVIDRTTFPVQRGILDVTIEINPAYRLRLLGVHLKSKRPVPEADQALMRRNEAHLLREYVDEILEADPEVNLLLYGDFNDTRNETPIQAIQGKFGSEKYLRDIWLWDDLGYRWTYFWDYADQYSRIDFVFVNWSLYPEIDFDGCRIHADRDWLRASDHRPLVITLTPEEKERKKK